MNFERQFARARSSSNFVRGVRRRPHADPLRALQQRSEVRDAGRARARASAPSRRDRPLRARRIARTPRRAATGCSAASTRRRTSRTSSSRSTQAQLARAMFPVGELTKADGARARARLGLPVADKPDSQEICFVPDGDYAAFVEQQRAGSAARRRSSRRRRHGRSAGTTASTASPSASARASGCSLAAARSTSSAIDAGASAGHRRTARGARARRR